VNSANMRIEVTTQSKFLKPEDVKDGDKITIVSEAIQEVKEFRGEKKSVVGASVRLESGEIKDMTFNNTSVKRIVDMFGEDSQDWVGKELTIEKVKMMIEGETKDVVYIKEDIPVIEA